MVQIATLELGEFTLDALAGEHGMDVESISSRLAGAIRYYLADRESGRPEWHTPTLPLDEAAGARVKLELSIDDSLWSSLREEAEQQGVTAQQLAVHAALYFAADRDAGRLTERIVDGLDT
jgi:hypothetical protein